jgi:maleylacetoacetate isomerase
MTEQQGLPMRLYGYYRSSASYRIRIVLHAKKIPFTSIPVKLVTGEHREADFRKINPQGFVPVLQHGDTVISQSAAIAEYLEETQRSHALMPAQAEGRSRVREVMGIVGSDIHPLQNLRILQYLRNNFGQDDDGVAEWCRHWIGHGFSAIEALLAGRSDGRYSIGEGLTLADAWLIPQVYNARRFELDLEPYPTIRSIEAYCTSLDAFRAAHPERQDDAPAEP